MSAPAHASVPRFSGGIALPMLGTLLLCGAGSLLEVVLAPLHGGVPPLEPTAGVALAAGLLGGPRMLLAASAGTFLACMVADAPVWLALVLALDTAVGAAVGAALLGRLRSFQTGMPRLADVLALAGRGAIAATLPGATIAFLSQNAAGLLPDAPAMLLWTRHWVADALGVLLFAPPLLAWFGGRDPLPDRARVLEGLIPGGATVLFGAWLFLCPQADPEWAGPMLVLAFPLLAWTGLRFSVRGTSLVLLLLATLAITSVATGVGPYREATGGLTGAAMSAFLFAAALTTLVLSGAHGELRTAMQARRTSEDLLRAVFDQATVGLSLMNSDLRRIMVNRAFARMLGYEERDLVGELPGSTAAPEEQASVTNRLADVLHGRTPGYEIERRFVRRDGSIVWGAVSVSRVQDASGTPGVLTAVHDVTDRRRTEDALRESEERFRAAFEQASVGMALRALDGRWLRVNSKLCEILGYERDELLGMTSVDLTPPDDRALAIENNERMARGDVGEVSREKRYLRKDGSIVWVHLSIGVVRGSDGTVLHQLSCVQDITDRKRAETALRDSEEAFRAMFEQAFVGINVRAFDGRWLRVNRRMCEITGRTEAEFMTTPPIEPTHPDDAQFIASMAQRMARGEVDGYTREKRYLRKDGTVIWANVSVTTLRDRDGRPAHRFSIVEDVTDRKHAEAAVHALNAELERRVAERTAALETSNRELEAFSHSVAHDLRAPLRAMDGYSRILLDDTADKLAPESISYLARIRAASQRMAELIDALLLLARITRSEMRHEPVDLSDLAHNCIAELQTRDGGRRVEIVVAAGLRTRGDRTLLRLALGNLLDNAWKFTSRAPAARIEVARAGTHDGLPAFVVRDNGSGFDMRYTSKLFGPFQRLHHATEFPGTGIGLATVERIFERHGGAIWAESEPGKGAAFYFALPG
jgi:PAS domain S-box-containing protein